MMSHSNTITHAYQVKLYGCTTRFAYLILDEFSHLVQMNMAGNDFIK